MNVRDTQLALVGAGYPVTVDGDMGPQTYSALFAFVGRQKPSDMTAALGRAADRWFATAGLVTPLRIAHALARWAVETGGFTRLEENLNYSADRLMAVWPRRFPTMAAAQACAGNPQALAEKVYGARLGNSAPGDGWKFRGRGLTQLTGKANYTDAARTTGLDLTGNPGLVAEPDTGLRVACTYWTSRGLNAAADRDDVAAVCALIQGAGEGLDEQRRYLARAKMVLR